MIYYDDKSELNYEIREEKAYICDSSKRIMSVTVPGKIMDFPVAGITKKAFLGCKSLREVSLPDTIESIGEWAFAFCNKLSTVTMPAHRIEIGKGVFDNDGALERIYCISSNSCDESAEHDVRDVCHGREEHENSEHAARLMAAVPVVMDAQYLLDPTEAGSKEWFGKWDSKLKDILSRPDDEGYHLYVLCGEEDLHFDYDEYLEYVRRKKSALSMLRIMNDSFLREPFRQRLIEYVRNHAKGCDSEAAWRYVLNDHPDDEDYFALLIECGCITPNNLEDILADMGERHAQIRSYLINTLQTGSEDDFFADLEL